MKHYVEFEMYLQPEVCPKMILELWWEDLKPALWILLMSMAELSKKDQNPGKEIRGIFCLAYILGLLALFLLKSSVRSVVS